MFLLDGRSCGYVQPCPIGHVARQCVALRLIACHIVDMSTPQDPTGDEIRETRQRAGLTQQQFAELVGAGPRTVSDWENGRPLGRKRGAVLRELDRIKESERGPSPFRDVPDIELIRELERRAAGRGRRATDDASNW